MAGMFSSIFSNVGDGVQAMEDNMDSATDSMAAQGDAGAAQLDSHMQGAMDRGDAAVDRAESVVAHTGNEISNTLDADVGVHAEFEVSVHGETSGSYTDGDGTGHDYGRSFDIGTGNTVVDENLSLGETVGNAFDATATTMHTMSDEAFDAMG